MPCRNPALAALCLALVSIALADAEHRLAVVAEPAAVTVDRAGAGQRLLQLPRLEFPVSIEAVCAAGSALSSVSIAVADSRQTFAAPAFAAGQNLATTLTLPKNQASPLALDPGCPAEPAATATTIAVSDAFTAQASLRCSRDGGDAVVYAVVSLGVDLTCPAAAEDQLPGAPAASF